MRSAEGKEGKSNGGASLIQTSGFLKGFAGVRWKITANLMIKKKGVNDGLCLNLKGDWARGREIKKKGGDHEGCWM